MRYPVIHQHDASDCGPAVLVMVAAYYKKRVSIARIRETAVTDRRGTNLAGLSSAAEQLGFQIGAVRASRVAIDQVRPVRPAVGQVVVPVVVLPAVAHWR